jgi:alkyl hydroperoxide reductase subunit D
MVFAAQAAASIMAMNNVYYRAMHALPESSYLQMPPGLRMSVMAKPGIDAVDFEYLSLAVSAINGCGLCIGSHTAHLETSGAAKTAIQHALKIAAIVHGIAQAITISTV